MTRPISPSATPRVRQPRSGVAIGVHHGKTLVIVQSTGGNLFTVITATYSVVQIAT
jgi:hypothetical protein